MPNEQDELTAIRITSFEVDSVAGDWRETTRRWHETSDLCKQVANFIWQSWELHHVAGGSPQKLREWLNARQQHGVKEAGKCPVQAMDNKLSNDIYHGITKTFPRLHTRVVVLLMNTITSDLKRHKAASGSLPGTSAVLLCQQARPSFSRPYPIPFDKDNCTIVPPSERGQNYQLKLRTWRVEEDGKTQMASVIDTVTLRCKGRRVQSQVAILARIASGEYAFRGSKLVYSKAKRKWFAQIAYRMPVAEKQGVDAERTALLRPSRGAGRNHQFGWSLRGPGFRRHPGGRLRCVPEIRRALLRQRWSRQSNYRVAGGSTKGHGTRRATAAAWKLHQRWKDFCKRLNHSVASEVVGWCVANRIGRLVYVQPSGALAERSFLGWAGKVEGREDSTGWPWFQVQTFLGYRCNQAGITLVVRSGGERSSDAKTPGSARKSAKRSGDKTSDCKDGSNGAKSNGKAGGKTGVLATGGTSAMPGRASGPRRRNG